MRYKIEYLKNNEVKVTDLINEATYYGKIVNDKVRANNGLALSQIIKAKDEQNV